MKYWIQAFRLRTLPLALAGWLVGISLAFKQVEIDWVVSWLTLLTAFLLQILSNLANDYGDASSGVDSLRKGEERMVQSGKISPSQMKRTVQIFVFVSLISGISLLIAAFENNYSLLIVFFVVGMIGIVAAIKYTVGENPYGYSGFGDVFVFSFFGLVLVFGTYFLQVQQLDWIILLPASAIGMLCVGVLNVNNIRDIESDKVSGKYSLPVRLGKKSAVLYHSVLLLGAVLLCVLFVYTQSMSWIAYLFVLTVPFFWKNVRATHSLHGMELDPYLKQMALTTLAFSILFSIGVLLG